MRRPTHVGDLLVGALNRHARKPVMHLGDTTLTGAQLAEKISQYVQALKSFGVVSGTAIGILSLNRPEVLMVIGAGQTQGYRSTALHPLGSLEDHAYVLEDAGIGTLIVDPSPLLVERAAQLVERVTGLRRILTLGPVPPELAHAAADLSAEADSHEALPLVTADLDPDHVTAILYTGGTTGRPKGVIGTAGTGMAMTQIQLAEWEWPARPRFLICTPLSHAGAAFFIPTAVNGGEIVVLPKFDPAEVLRVIEERRITAMMVVPSMLYALLDHADSHTRDLSSLETVYYGASAINPVRLSDAIERFGPIFAQFYGQAEAPMAITYLARADHDEKRLSSCGRPSIFARTALLDRDDHPVVPGEPGEICVSGSLLAGGYWNRPEETDATFRNGWLHTGDVAREDEDGFWHIVDRVKDMIVSGGFNVYPREVEDVIAEHPAVAQVCVIGAPDDRWGEAVTAIVVLREDAAQDPASIDEMATQIRDMVKERKGAVQTPKKLLVAESLPLTAVGKVDKKLVRGEFWATADRNIG